MEDSLSLLRLKKFPTKTRRFHGRRAITPIRNRKNKRYARTRSHNRLEESNGVPVLQRTDSHVGEKREEDDKKEHSGCEKREGDKDGLNEGKGAHAEKHETPDTERNSQHSELTVHPGSVQGLPTNTSEDSENAVRASANATHLEEEEPSF